MTSKGLLVSLNVIDHVLTVFALQILLSQALKYTCYCTDPIHIPVLYSKRLRGPSA